MAFKVNTSLFTPRTDDQQQAGGFQPIQERKFTEPESPGLSPEDEQGIIADFVDKFQQGAWGAAADVVTGARGLLTDDKVWEMEQALRNRVTAQEETLSTAQKEADAGFSMFGDGEFTGRGFGGALFQGAGSLIPSVGVGIATGGVGALGTKALGMGATAGQVAGGALAGAPMIGGGAMNQVREELDTMPEEQFATLPDFDMYYRTAMQQSPDDPIAAMKMAREIYTQDAEQRAVKQGAAVGAVSMGAAVPMLDKIVRGGAGVVGGAQRGAGTEFLQEGFESGGQEAVVNPLVGRERFEGVPEAAATGAVLGGIIGGGLGGVGGLRREPTAAGEPDVVPAGPGLPPYTETPLIRGGAQPVSDTRRERPWQTPGEGREGVYPTYAPGPTQAEQREAKITSTMEQEYQREMLEGRDIPLADFDNNPVLIRQALNEGLVNVDEAEQALDIISKTPAPVEQIKPELVNIPKPDKSILEMDAKELGDYRTNIDTYEQSVVQAGDPNNDLQAVNEIQNRLDILERRAKEPVELIKGRDKDITARRDRKLAKQTYKDKQAAAKEKARGKSPEEKLQEHVPTEAAHDKAFLGADVGSRETMTPEEIYNRNSKRMIDDYTKQMDEASTDRDKVEGMSGTISQDIDMFVDDDTITKEDAGKLEQAIDDNLFKYAGDLQADFREKQPKKYEKFLPAKKKAEPEVFDIEKEADKQVEEKKEAEKKTLKDVLKRKEDKSSKDILVDAGVWKDFARTRLETKDEIAAVLTDPLYAKDVEISHSDMMDLSDTGVKAVASSRGIDLFNNSGNKKSRRVLESDINDTVKKPKTEQKIVNERLKKAGQPGKFEDVTEIAEQALPEQEEDWDYKVANFKEPKETVNLTTGPESKEYMPKSEADAQLAEWKAEAKRIGKEEDHSNEVILSFFDASGEISKPWREAGYDVLQYDIKLGDDLMEFFPTADFQEIEARGKTVVGLIAQPPCTCFSASGARWWKGRHDKHDRDMVDKMFGAKASQYFSKPKEYTKALVSMIDVAIEFTSPGFTMVENPVGRIASEMGLPKPTLVFNPNNFGDPYTKKTQLWGNFNTDLPTANVEPTEGSLMHKMWSTAEKDGGDRSLTSEPFAYSFFMANHKAESVSWLPGAEPEIKKDEQGRTEAQLKAGNYKKIHKSWNGLDIAIENAEGTKRSGTDEDGKAWETTMQNDYGYIKRTKGADGDHVDVFMGPNLTSDKVYVVNQTNKDGSFDEHKVMVGFNTKAAAEKGYLANYQPGWDQFTDLAETNTDGFKTWLEEDSQKKPANFEKATAPTEAKVEKDTTKKRLQRHDNRMGKLDYAKTFDELNAIEKEHKDDKTTFIQNREFTEHLEYVRKNFVEQAQEYNIEHHNTLVKKLNTGKMKLDEFKQSVQNFRDSKDDIMTMLNSRKYTVKQLQRMAGYMMRGDEKKAEIADNVFDRLQTLYLLDNPRPNLTWVMGVGNMQKGVDEQQVKINELIDGATQEDLDNYAKGIQEAQAKREADKKAREEAVKEPKSLDDFREFIKVKGKDKLSPDQLESYDRLITAEMIARRKEVADREASRQAKSIGDVDVETAETKHTKTGEDLYVVKLADRIDRERFNTMRRVSKQYDGYYSRYSAMGAIPGFQFKSESDRDEFIAAVSTGEVKTEKKPKTNQERIAEMGDRLIAKGEESLNQDRQTNTARRAGMAASAEAAAESNITTGKLLKAIADADTDYLHGITALTQLEELQKVLNRAEYKAPDELKDKDSMSRKTLKEGVTLNDYIQYAEFPSPIVRRDGLQSLANDLSDKVGYKAVAKSISSVLKRTKDENINLDNYPKIDQAKIKKYAKLPGVYGSSTWIADYIQSSERLEKIGITSLPHLRMALRELNNIQEKVAGVSPEQKQAKKLKQMERELVGKKLAGFFPTPKPVVDRMLDEAEIGKNDSVLEPSAGIGNIADELKEYSDNVDVIEMASDPREILEAKGHNVVAQDFLEYDAKKYDKIIMNPPFEKFQDIDHVRHAYELLNPDGRVVAIMGAGVNNTRKKAVEFRQWVEEQGGVIESLPEGSFKSAFRPTGVNTVMVTIDKQAADVEVKTDQYGLPVRDGTVETSLTRIKQGIDTLNVAQQESVIRGDRKLIYDAIKEKSGTHDAYYFDTKLDSQYKTDHEDAFKRANDVLGLDETLQSGIDDSVNKFAKKLEKDLDLKSLNLYMSKGDLKLDTIIVGKDDRKQGKGTEALTRITEYADENNLRVLLSPAVKDDYQGTTSRARLVKFYKRFGFKENKGRNKDFRISESMIRPAAVLESKAKTKVVGEHPAFSFLGVGEPSGLSERQIFNIINDKYGRPLFGASKFRNLTIINDPNKKWRGQYNPKTKKMELNAYYLTQDDAVKVLHHEKVHEHIRKDPELERIANNIMARAKKYPNSAAGKAYEIAKDRTALKKGKVKNYDSVVLEETLAYLVQYYNKPGHKSALKEYIAAIRKFFSKFIGIAMNEDIAVDYVSDMVSTEVAQYKEDIPVLTKKVTPKKEPIDPYEAELLKSIEGSYESTIGDKIGDLVNKEKQLSDKVDKAYESGKVELADKLDAELAEVREQLDSAVAQTEYDYEGDKFEDMESDLSESLKSAWGKYKDKNSYAYRNKKEFLNLARGALNSYGVDEGITDDALLTLAKELSQQPDRSKKLDINKTGKQLKQLLTDKGIQYSALGDVAQKMAPDFESDWIDNTKSYVKRHMWGTLNVRQISEILGKYAPLIKDKYIDRFKLYESDMNEMKQIAGDIANIRQDLPRDINEKLAKVQSESTIEGFDPSVDQVKTAEQKAILDSYDGLTAAAQKVYKEERNYHKNMHDTRLKELKNRINDIEGDQGFKELMIDKLTEEFSKASKNGPYFPLARFGQFWVSSENAAGEKSFDMFENETAQKHFVDQLRATPGEDVLGFGRQLDKLQEVSKGVDGKFIAEIDKLVKRAGGDDSLRDDIFQLYLESLPELSSRKKYLHRKKTKGFSKDQAKAFAHASRADANDIARIKHIHVLQDMIDQTEISLNIASSRTLKKQFENHAGALQKILDETPFEITDQDIADLNEQAPFKTFQLQQTGNPEAEIKRILAKEKSLLRNADKIDETKITFVSSGLSELKASHEAMVNANVHPIASGLNSLGFLWYLGASPAAALVNLTQTPTVALPMMLADKSLKGSSGHLTKAVADFMKGKGSIEPTLNANEKKAFEFWHKSGLLENTQAHDLSGIADSGIDTGTFKNKAMRMISFMFHRAEVMNREVTALATYRAAIEGGMKPADAMKKASDLTWDSHLDYGASNRARFMRGNFARVITQFKQYSQGITYIYARTAFQAFKGESKADRQQAMKLLGMLIGSQISVAGTLGLPMAGIVMGIAQGLEDALGDEDDPVSMKAEFRQAMSDFAGKTGGQAISHGLIDAFTPLSVSGRLSMADLWVRTPDYDQEGKAEALSYIEALGGPMVSIFTNAFMAKESLKQGEFLRAAESMTPKFIKDFVRSGRYIGEGNLTRAGLKIKDMTPAEMMGQALGFSASEVSEIRERATGIKNIERQRGARRKDIIDSWIAGDDGIMEDIQAWNVKHPRDRITGDTLRSAKRSKMRYARQVTKGVRETKRTRDLIEKYDY